MADMPLTLSQLDSISEVRGYCEQAHTRLELDAEFGSSPRTVSKLADIEQIAVWRREEELLNQSFPLSTEGKNV